MSFTQTCLFTDSTNYSYDSSLIEFVGGNAQLKLCSNCTYVFNQPFDSDTGFTYDNTKSEFSGGQVQQKDNTPTDETFYAGYLTSSLNASRGAGVLTGTGSGSPVVTDGKLDMSDNVRQYVDYDANLNTDSQQVGCIEMDVYPNYTGSPLQSQYFFCVSRANNDGRNLVILYQQNNGNMYFIIKDSGGVTLLQPSMGAWSPTSGTKYRFSFNWDLTAGEQRLFIDGVQFGATYAAAGTRDGNINLLRFGENVNPVSGKSNFMLDNIQYFTTVQHTSNYTPGTVQEYKYFSTTVTLPEMPYTGPGTLISFDLFETVETNAPRYTIQVGRSGNYIYWNGSAWVTSDGSYAQANDVTTFNANVSSMDILGEVYGQFKIHFDDSNTQSATADLTATVTGQTYPSTNPTIAPISCGTLRLEALESFTHVASISGDDNIKYVLKKGSSFYYHDGSSWVVSDETYAQSNTVAEIQLYRSTFTTESVSFTWKAFLHSDSGQTTPALTSITITYDFHGGDANDPNKIIVYGWAYDITGTVLQSASVSAQLTASSNKYDSGLIVTDTVISTTTDSVGYWELELVETDNMDGAKYVFTFAKNNWKSMYTRQVPNNSSGVAMFTDLIE